MRKYNATNDELVKIMEDMTKARKICKCGHSVLLTSRDNKQICGWCGEYVFKDKKAEFEYRMKEKQLRERRNLK